ncbi:MAG: hypothetical protein WC817_03415 [Patescibacteria group bacterium]|jgi:enolase
MRVTGINDILFREVFDSKGDAAIKATVKTLTGQTATATVSCVGVSDAKVNAAIDFGNTKLRKALRGIDTVEQNEVDRRIVSLVRSFANPAAGRLLARAVSQAVARVGARAAGRELHQHLREFAPFSGPGWALPVPVFEFFSNNTEEGFKTVSLSINPRASKGPRRSLVTLMALARKTLASFHRLLPVVLHSSLVRGSGRNITLEEVLTAIVASAKKIGLRNSDVRIAVDFGQASVLEDERAISSEFFPEKEDTAMLQLCHSLIRRYPIGMIENAFQTDNAYGHAQRHFANRVTFLRHDLAAKDAAILEKAVIRDEVGAAAIDLACFDTVSDALDYAVQARGMNLARVLLTPNAEAIDDFLVDFGFAVSAEYLKLGSFLRGEHIVRYNRLLDLAHQQTL